MPFSVLPPASLRHKLIQEKRNCSSRRVFLLLIVYISLKMFCQDFRRIQEITKVCFFGKFDGKIDKRLYEQQCGTWTTLHVSSRKTSIHLLRTISLAVRF